MKAILAPATLALLSACATVSTQDSPPVDIRIAGERVFPESIASDAAGNLYIVDLTGSVYRIDPE